MAQTQLPLFASENSFWPLFGASMMLVPVNTEERDVELPLNSSNTSDDEHDDWLAVESSQERRARKAKFRAERDCAEYWRTHLYMGPWDEADNWGRPWTSGSPPPSGNGDGAGQSTGPSSDESPVGGLAGGPSTGPSVDIPVTVAGPSNAAASAPVNSIPDIHNSHEQDGQYQQVNPWGSNNPYTAAVAAAAGASNNYSYLHDYQQDSTPPGAIGNTTLPNGHQLPIAQGIDDPADHHSISQQAANLQSGEPVAQLDPYQVRHTCVPQDPPPFPFPLSEIEMEALRYARPSWCPRPVTPPRPTAECPACNPLPTTADFIAVQERKGKRLAIERWMDQIPYAADPWELDTPTNWSWVGSVDPINGEGQCKQTGRSYEDPAGCGIDNMPNAAEARWLDERMYMMQEYFRSVGKMVYDEELDALLGLIDYKMTNSEEVCECGGRGGVVDRECFRCYNRGLGGQLYLEHLKEECNKPLVCGNWACQTCHRERMYDGITPEEGE